MAILAAIGIATSAAGAALSYVGFTTAGVAAGSVAAGLQAGIGNVVAGSAFAIAQSLGMSAVFATAIPVGAAVAAVGVAASLLL